MTASVHADSLLLKLSHFDLIFLQVFSLYDLYFKSEYDFL